MGLLKGIVRSYSSGDGTAEVELPGSHGRYITVPVATHLDSSAVVAGKLAVLAGFDERNPDDVVLVAT